jgi:head-tail adaptor
MDRTEAADGNPRGQYAPAFTVWAGFRPMSSQKRSDYGYVEDIASGWLKLRESSQVGTITIADRVAFADPLDEFAIDAVPVKDRSGYRLLRISRKM